MGLVSTLRAQTAEGLGSYQVRAEHVEESVGLGVQSSVLIVMALGLLS